MRSRAEFLVSAANKSSGKTTISIGLSALLTTRGFSVQPFKKGPDYIDGMWLGQAARRSCLNLDYHTMTDGEIHDCFDRNAWEADVALVEGTKGLYDGVDPGGADCNAALAKMLDLPVVLVLDAEGITRGIAPLVLGYQAFDRQVRIAAVILNNIAGARHEHKLRAAMERYTDLPVLGAVARAPDLGIQQRHLGLIPSTEDGSSAERIRQIARRVGDQVDVDRLLAVCAREARPEVRQRPVESGAATVPQVRIGVARDAAFGFYYPDDLQRMQRAGASVIYFDTLNDSCLPPVDALFMGGGFPETHMAALESNVSLRRHIRRFVDSGNPVYAECGGLMYLCRSLSWHGERRDMVGAIPADAVMQSAPVGRGYVRLQETADHPWPVVNEVNVHEPIQVHEFHYSRLENLAPDLRYAYRVLRGVGVDGLRDGLMWRNTLATYSHQRSVAANDWVARFVQHVRNHRLCCADVRKAS